MYNEEHTRKYIIFTENGEKTSLMWVGMLMKSKKTRGRMSSTEKFPLTSPQGPKKAKSVSWDSFSQKNVITSPSYKLPSNPKDFS